MASADKIKVICSVENLRYWKNEWGIAEVSIDKIKEGTPKTDKYNHTIIKGCMPQLIIGNTYTLIADYVEDNKYGGQYNVNAIYNSIAFDEQDKNGQKSFCQHYLQKIKLKNIYEALDDPYDTLTKNNAMELIKVKGCGMDTAARWIDKFNKKHTHG